ncbi:MAG: methyltransferase domain-containing protein [Elusimicrobia bacterium]|nr:methyltransferase domain-containing protein [Elusimicrobiota bacterium]
MSQDPWVELESVIRAQLALQVELSFDRHHRFMMKHGLARCQNVVDIGTGNGLFLGKVAQRHPETNFHGVDDKAHMIEEARARNHANASWTQADAQDESVQAMLGASDGILMRYFVLHLPKTSAALPRILSRVTPCTRLWILDLDTDHCVCEPEHPAFSSFQDLVRSFCDKNSVEIRTASMLSPILEAAGFEMREVSVEPFNNREIDPKLFAEYLFREATLYHHFLEGTRSSQALREMERFFFEVMRPATHFVQYGMTMISAVKRPFPGPRRPPGQGGSKPAGAGWS